MSRRYFKGFTLIEVLIVIATVGLLAVLVAAIPNAISSITKSRHASLARDVASRQIDNLRKQGYLNLANGSSSFSDTDLMLLPNSVAIFEVEDCPVTICAQSEQAKKVKVVVKWQEKGATFSSEVTTIVSSGGVGQY